MLDEQLSTDVQIKKREKRYLDPPPNGRKVRRRVDDDDHTERFWVICRCEAGGFLEVMSEFPDG